MRKFLSGIKKEIRWRYKMWRTQVFVSYVVDNGVVYMNVAKTGFFIPLHRQQHLQISIKNQETCSQHASYVD